MSAKSSYVEKEDKAYYYIINKKKPVICNIDPISNCHLVISNKPRSDGYIMFSTSENNKLQHHFAHRKVYQEFIGKIEKGLCVMHSCDNASCINVNHLSLGTHKDNMLDKKEKGRENILKGYQRASSFLSVSDIIWIKNNLENYTDQEFSKMFGGAYQTYFYIRNGKQWASVLKTDNPNDEKFTTKNKKLSISDIETICSYKFTISQLASMYNCSKNSISCIRRGVYPKYIQELMSK
jgi:hypothetical protein